MGQIYFLGAGVDQNYGLAFHYLNKSAQKGDAASMTVLAQLYGEVKGTQKNGVKAAGLHWVAATKGHGVAQVAIGELMTNPENGSQDTLRGLMWLYLAMEQNNVITIAPENCNVEEISFHGTATEPSFIGRLFDHTRKRV